MRVLKPADWPEALALRAQHPAAVPVSGGTDVMVGLRAGRLRPDILLDLSRVPGLGGWRVDRDWVRLGAGTTYTGIADGLAGSLPGLAAVARAVGSRQVRNRGTLGGSLGTAAPTGDPHPMLLAIGAEIELSSANGTRRVPVDRFYRPQGGTALAADELIHSVRLPVVTGPQRFARVGARRGMVKSACSCAIVLDAAREEIRVAVGGYGPAPHRAADAEALLREQLWTGGLTGDLLGRFGRLVAASATPVTDLRATAAYRRHAIAVLAGRNLQQVWESHRRKEA
ncbi:FAD binding domain-containing protein [Kibdelosporangium phytohabitans]|uniref:FAD-binding PCMH-type domain-containing protein n=1 Tax=Kibdelosporangium phytohabitans TaxID=860235 RepID=A0A0N7F3V3_9PSEU|nr:FAD binding domain-containing protein [Kibdelosporangium phytohabitans]ALG09671.1 hypothetical protein AOZ06_24665 [Kibdelosporangium phytohabitans]MBE1468982.1 CO/xanthine dehydrogenase FAD-binding subunit [Kibdelosporangium phytohabitans]